MTTGAIVVLPFVRATSPTAGTRFLSWPLQFVARGSVTVLVSAGSQGDVRTMPLAGAGGPSGASRA